MTAAHDGPGADDGAPAGDRRLRDPAGPADLAVIDLAALPAAGDGVAWSTSPEGVHVNLVVLGSGGGIGAHRNDEVEVVVVVLAGAGTLDVDGHAHPLAPGSAAVLPRGAVRRIGAGADGLRYLTVHRARRPMGIGGSRPRTG